MEQIVGTCTAHKEEATYIAEGWVNPKTQKLYQWLDDTIVPRYVIDWYDTYTKEKEERERRRQEGEEEKGDDVFTNAAEAQEKCTATNAAEKNSIPTRENNKRNASSSPLGTQTQHHKKRKLVAIKQEDVDNEETHGRTSTSSSSQ
eukprot:7414898-Ditylum_brightwellii.AAC.1